MMTYDPIGDMTWQALRMKLDNDDNDYGYIDFDYEQKKTNVDLVPNWVKAAL